MKMIGRATNPEVLTASTQASFRNAGATKGVVTRAVRSAAVRHQHSSGEPIRLWVEAPLASPAWLMRPRPGNSASTRRGFACACQLCRMRRICTTCSRTGGYAGLGKRARLSGRGGPSDDRRRDDRRLENRRAWSVHSRDRGTRPAGGRPSWAHDLRHTRLDALDLGKGRKSCSARAWLGLDAGALGTRIRDRGSRSHSRLGT